MDEGVGSGRYRIVVCSQEACEGNPRYSVGRTTGHTLRSPLLSKMKCR